MLETRIVRGILPEGTPREVGRELRQLLERGVRIRPAGAGRKRPEALLASGYAPKQRIRLFDTTYYLTDLRYEELLLFFVAYVLPRSDSREIYPRIVCKDYSLVWRAPTHFIRSENENWMGKGDVRAVVEDGQETLFSAEETTNLPLELQSALDAASRRVRHPSRDDRAVELFLREAPDDRLEPYADFAAPRRRARSDPRNRIHRGRPVAWFTRKNDPGSLRFARGFEPDFRRGVLEVGATSSRFYAGEVRKIRILSTNRKIQYLFMVAPRYVWILPPQALTTEITSYGVRSIDVEAAEELFVPAHEYHFLDETARPPRIHSQIPEGFAGAPSQADPDRVDASAWIERLPVVQEFRRALRIPSG